VPSAAGERADGDNALGEICAELIEPVGRAQLAHDGPDPLLGLEAADYKLIARELQRFALG
jgi:hypothetical protein